MTLRKFRWRKGTAAGKLQVFGSAFLAAAAVAAGLGHTGLSALPSIVLGALGLALVVVGTLLPSPLSEPDVPRLSYQLVRSGNDTHLRIENIGNGEARNLRVWAELSPHYFDREDPDGPGCYGLVIGPRNLTPGSSVGKAISAVVYQLLYGGSRLSVIMSWVDDVAEHKELKVDACNTLLTLQ
jgi:hypothetical protein